MIQSKQNVVHLPVYQPGKPVEELKRELGLEEVIKLASNENPFGCSPKVKEAILEILNETSIYPDGSSQELTQVLAPLLGVQDNQIVYGAGSDEIILMLSRAYFVPGDETVMAEHTFGQYKHNATIEGAKVIEVPLIEGKHDLVGMLERITDKTKIVWICNPNNPTGTIVTKDELQRFLDRVPEQVLVVLDEAYAEYIDTPEFPSGVELNNHHSNVIVLRTFSKIYGMASLRIGYGIGDPDVIRTVNQVRPPFNTTRYAQKAAAAALKDQAFIASCREKNKEGRDYLTTEFNRMQLDMFPAFGNFIMVDVHRPAEKVFNELLKRGVIVRGGHQLDFPTSLRVTIGSRQQNEKFIAALEEVLKEVE